MAVLQMETATTYDSLHTQVRTAAVVYQDSKINKLCGETFPLEGAHTVYVGFPFVEGPCVTVLRFVLHTAPVHTMILASSMDHNCWACLASNHAVVDGFLETAEAEMGGMVEGMPISWRYDGGEGMPGKQPISLATKPAQKVQLDMSLIRWGLTLANWIRECKWLLHINWFHVYKQVKGSRLISNYRS